ncbi:bifunctional DNA primase/polymerase [Planococcus faecalis]|uniref:DNA primase n=1 Tax=Planococcus faecalis TaxID=1598147 RepID=A0ABN4XIK9_9BACL|nr:bifunctional DNA primase/polymerase [Planococcus faecalis]AQU78308.1 hypothetical protein AJGP001_02895 [Planococcus faecalis]OHX51306.1 hypothetical protein BB777_17345 [Planococcus faecalis]
MANKNLQIASAYASMLSFAVFPIVPASKAPLTKNGFKDASKDAAQISRWWASNSAAGIGIPTGEVSGIIVIDVDPRNGGDVSLERLTAEYGELPDTVHCLTGGGGDHFYFKYDGRVTKSSLVDYPGLDFQGNGKYVVAPPSVHPSGNSYEWEESSKPVITKLAPLPEWLIKLLKGTPKQRQATPVKQSASHWERVMNGLSEGEGRNPAAASLAGHLLRRYVDPDIVIAVLNMVNERNDPPLDPDELSTIINSIAGKEIERRKGAQHGQYQRT